MRAEQTEIATVAVLGAGTMGHGIAEVTAIAGYDVVLRDIEADIVEDGYEEIEWSLEKLAEKGRLDEDPDDVAARVATTTDLEAAVSDADLVIEAGPEQLSVKQDIFEAVDAAAPEDALLATNSSSLSITEIAAATERPDSVLGLHFFNPPVKMDLVEVIYGEATTDETAQRGYEFIESLGKTPIYVRKDVRGFVVNSVLGPFMSEPAWMVSAGEATIRQADAAMVHERGYPMGPFELGDLTGIDIGYHVRTEAGTPIPPIMEEKVENENLGRKTGKGYYDYDDGGGPEYVPEDAEGFDHLRVEAVMANEAAKLVGDDVATAEAIDTGMRLGAGFPEGTCRRADDIGLDNILGKLRTLYDKHGDDRYEPAEYLVELVEAGHTGTEAGRGFHEYDTGDGPGDYHTINWELDDDGLLEVELDRPSRMNAISETLADEVVDLLSSVDEDDVRAVVFEGAGDRAFSAGADISGFADRDPAQTSEPTAVFTTVAEYPRPTLARIDGYCLGAGLELALACDLRLATTDSEFGFPEITLGLLPGGGGTQRAIRMLTDARAKELVFRGEHISAERAADWGLINRAVDADEFDDVVEEFVSDLVSGPPIALRKAKRVMNEGADESLDAGLEMESQAFALLLTTDDVAEGTAAFAADREPEFEGE
ncbi:3-hydroxyacyl-CoA dehydrogenase NAD-binding domain-containing protein [Haloarcula sp. H-GB4]|uniref:3-hydroxyacyl-CoA dehydrogenase/enoyl-CoA hydratase family protein n=1 Tax=Haloarcula sp. H-GB4 TaxID=3069755 RepID=UPI0027B79A7F|nr:3-hydroxyacyl-CoA dehydrogenase NAD-binding domain-containing protein [Haloarcula sp. H-GB4]MDQ2073223.1 3-hydroxyacyl-CoA dehydrogenase NAD-binding domain-containing protein [Haloarcula sp. H-GB4]